jgi:4-hydroxybenzoate polyprenyltransferase
MLIPAMKNHVFTPTASATGLLINRPAGIVIDEISVRTENARPIFSGATVS